VVPTAKTGLSLGAGLSYPALGVLGHLVPLGVHGVGVEVVDGDGGEGARADVEGDGGAGDAAGVEGVEQGGAEVEPRGGGGDGAGTRGEDGLVPVFVGLGGPTTEVRRQRDFAVGLDGGPGLVGAEGDREGGVVVAGVDVRGEARGEGDLHARPQGLRGAAQGAPGDARGVVGAEEKHLGLAAARFGAAEARGNHPRVVEHHQGAGREELRQVAHGAVLQGRVAAGHDQQTRGVALGQWVRGDERLGEVIIEVVDPHRRDHRTESVRGEPPSMTAPARRLRAVNQGRRRMRSPRVVATRRVPTALTTAGRSTRVLSPSCQRSLPSGASARSAPVAPSTRAAPDRSKW
jgi:hypothetical protein